MWSCRCQRVAEIAVTQHDRQLRENKNVSTRTYLIVYTQLVTNMQGIQTRSYTYSVTYVFYMYGKRKGCVHGYTHIHTYPYSFTPSQAYAKWHSKCTGVRTAHPHTRTYIFTSTHTRARTHIRTHARIKSPLYIA